jgi:Domain of unknown function DUF29
VKTCVTKDDDFNAWLLDQTDALRSRRSTIDWDGLAEEFEATARKDHIELRSRLQNLLSHLLKWAYEPSHRGKSWTATINESRDRIEDLLEESPSLKNELMSAFAKARVYRRALRDAAVDTDGKVQFPQCCPWALDDVLNPDFFPDR